MKEKLISARICRAAVWAVMVLIFLLCGAAPGIAQWLLAQNLILYDAISVMLLAFYPCALVAECALLLMGRLLGSILAGEVFTHRNVKRIRRIALCCGLVALVCLPAGFVFLGLLFVSIIMAFLCLVVCVVGSLMSAATALREENDLTI